MCACWKVLWAFYEDVSGTSELDFHAPLSEIALAVMDARRIFLHGWAMRGLEDGKGDIFSK